MYSVHKFEKASEAIEKIISTFNIKEMYIPYYICPTVRHAIFRQKCKPIFYHINDNFMPLDTIPKDSYILYPNYFGICAKNVNNLTEKYPKLIVDNAHAFFEKPLGIACINAEYKFNLGNYSYLWINDNSKSDIIVPEYTQEKAERQKKFFELDKIYSETNLLKIDKNSIPFCYPYLAKTETDSDELAKQLTQKGLTIYRYWEPMPENFNEYKFYKRLVPIPI